MRTCAHAHPEAKKHPVESAANTGVTADRFTSLLLPYTCRVLECFFFLPPLGDSRKRLFRHSVATHVFVSRRFRLPDGSRIYWRCLKSQASLQAKPLLGLHPCVSSPLFSSSLCLSLSSARCRSDSQCTVASAAALTLHTLQGNFNRIYWQAGRECA